MRWRNAGGAAQADPLGEWSLFGTCSCQVQGIPEMMTGAWMEETAQPPITHLPITTFLAICFSIFLLHRFASNVIIY